NKSKSTSNKKSSGKADKAYKVLGKWYYPLATSKGYNQTGNASWYGKRFHGGPTASGEKFDMNALTGAHTTLPFNSKVKVTNIDTGANVILRINDRGPFREDRLIDVSAAAAERLGFNGKGEIKVRVEGLE
ncbi:MAG: septal ring lytic transglycosylase RlpA family protein, partial [Mariprofundaceae bacterium]|nr:septal ring lytic transglycosylase RlpA family protein [Mariprofundaceae bacterium]